MKKIEFDIENIAPKDDYNYFFGYYEKNPWNKDETKVLANRTKLLTKFPTQEDFLEIGYINTIDKEFVSLGNTNSWNWQQGCQLQWIYLENDSKEYIIFNFFEDQQVKSKIIDIEGSIIKTNDFSIYTKSENNDILTLDYARLFDCRKDYGYSLLKDINSKIDVPKNDGIWFCNLKNNSKELIVSIEDVVGFNNIDIPKKTKHWLNHMFFNPSGTRFCFLHRYERNDGIVQSRLFTSSLKGNDLRLIFDGMISHYDWKDDTTILAWAGKRKLINNNNDKANKSLKSLLMLPLKKLLKPIYYALGKPRFLMQKIMGDSYYLIKDTENLNNYKKIAEGVLTSDGHCTLSHDGEFILTDGYTDKQNKLPLYIYDINTNKKVLVGKYWTPKELDNEFRVDLHPRFNKDSTKILIDSAMNNKREMFIIKIKK